MLSVINRGKGVLSILAAGVLCAFASTSYADSAVTPGSRAAGLDACVAPTDDMRRNHMEYIKHQRVRTVHEGVRGSEFSLVGCVDCHAAIQGGKPVPINAEGQFCHGCHDFTAVSIDCFQCHRGIPSQASLLSGTRPTDLKGLRMALEVALPAAAAGSGAEQSRPVTQED